MSCSGARIKDGGARRQWRQDQPLLDAAKLVFLDETGTATDMARLRGRGPRAKRVIGKVLCGHWKTTTFVAGPPVEQPEGVAPSREPGTIKEAGPFDDTKTPSEEWIRPC